MMIRIAYLLVLTIFASESIETQKIEFLIQKVKESNLEFIRNGKTYSSTQAASHLKLKYNRAKGLFFVSEVKVKDFIEKIASKSSFTGKDYYIKKKNGNSIKTREWLKAKLKEFP